MLTTYNLSAPGWSKDCEFKAQSGYVDPIFRKRRKKQRLGILAHNFYPSTKEAETGRLVVRRTLGRTHGSPSDGEMDEIYVSKLGVREGNGGQGTGNESLGELEV